MSGEPVPTPECEQGLEDVVLAYLQAADAGQALDPRAVLARHPALAAELVEFFADEEHLAPLLRPLRCDPLKDAIPATGSYPAPDTSEEVPRVAPPADEDPPEIPGYEVLALQGKGGMGIVYKARHRGLNRIVALKMIRSHRLADPDARARFHAEAQAVARLDHPNIVHVWDHGEHDGQPYLSLEFVEGGSLAESRQAGPWPARKVAALVALLADAVEHAHQQGIVHRDLKPANVLLTPAGVPKVADFGLARFMQADDPCLTQPGDRLGTPLNMAPEQALGRSEEIGPRTDVFGLGTILYELLTGQSPYEGVTARQVIEQAQQGRVRRPRQVHPGVPRALERICLKALAKDPQQRYPTAAALAADLRRSLCPPWRRMLVSTAAAIGLLVASLLTWAVAGRPGGVVPDPILDPKPPPSPAPGRRPVDPSLVQSILQKSCHRCHGDKGSIEGGFNYVLDRGQLVTRRKMVVPGNPGASRLWQRIKEGQMPPEGETPRLSDEEMATLEQWIREGAPAFHPPEDRPFIATDRILTFIRDDLEKADRKDREFLRYFTITHLYNAGLPEDGLDTYRLALFKLVNSLSWQREIARPAAVDPQRTVFRIDLRDYQWNETVWRLILAAYPYGFIPRTETAEFCRKATRCPLPFVRADWFVFAASRPPLYHEVLQLPGTALALETRLGVDVKANRRQHRRVARAGFNGSGVAVSNNRLIERHAFNDGAYWHSFDFAHKDRNGEDRRNLFQYPLGPGGDGFRHDGGEIIYSLPNGLQGYLLVNGRGERIDRGPTDIVVDKEAVKKGLNPAVVNGISCMSCHVRGVIDATDFIRKHVANERRSFSEEVVREVLDLYPRREDFKQLLKADEERFARAVQAATGAPPGGTDPIVALAARYEWEVDRDLAAADAGLRKEEFLRELDRAKELSLIFGVLQAEGGTVQRQVWEDNFGKLVRELKLGDPVVVAADTLTNSIGMTLKRIAAGTFRMGSTGHEDKEEPPHKVEITRPFFLGICEVTQEEYEKVMGTNPSHFKGPDTARHPVEQVSWEDAVAFCRKLSDRPEERAHGRVYRLPTEAEWEYAARAGSDSAYSFGEDPRLLNDHAWYSGNAGGGTHAVGAKAPNAWGLHDMHGNVREWCADYYDARYYARSAARDPSGPSESASTLRVLRGGSYEDKADACRSATRSFSFENFPNGKSYGFRVVLTIGETNR